MDLCQTINETNIRDLIDDLEAQHKKTKFQRMCLEVKEKLLQLSVEVANSLPKVSPQFINDGVRLLEEINRFVASSFPEGDEQKEQEVLKKYMLNFHRLAQLYERFRIIVNDEQQMQNQSQNTDSSMDANPNINELEEEALPVNTLQSAHVPRSQKYYPNDQLKNIKKSVLHFIKQFGQYIITAERNIDGLFTLFVMNMNRYDCPTKRLPSDVLFNYTLDEGETPVAIFPFLLDSQLQLLIEVNSKNTKKRVFRRVVVSRKTWNNFMAIGCQKDENYKSLRVSNFHRNYELLFHLGGSKFLFSSLTNQDDHFDEKIKKIHCIYDLPSSNQNKPEIVDFNFECKQRNRNPYLVFLMNEEGKQKIVVSQVQQTLIEEISEGSGGKNPSESSPWKISTLGEFEITNNETNFQKVQFDSSSWSIFLFGTVKAKRPEVAANPPNYSALFDDMMVIILRVSFGKEEGNCTFSKIDQRLVDVKYKQTRKNKGQNTIEDERNRPDNRQLEVLPHKEGFFVKIEKTRRLFDLRLQSDRLLLKEINFGHHHELGPMSEDDDYCPFLVDATDETFPEIIVSRPSGVIEKLYIDDPGVSTTL